MKHLPKEDNASKVILDMKEKALAIAKVVNKNATGTKLNTKCVDLIATMVLEQAESVQADVAAANVAAQVATQAAKTAFALALTESIVSVAVAAAGAAISATISAANQTDAVAAASLLESASETLRVAQKAAAETLHVSKQEAQKTLSLAKDVAQSLLEGAQQKAATKF